jgi:cystathionine gamma-synthase
MPERNDLAPATLAAQALGWIDESTGAVIPPAHFSTTHERDADNEFRRGFNYIRGGNPTWRQVEALLARLEGGEDALVLASGMSAATAVFLALKPGDHVVAPKVAYYALRKWLEGPGTEWGLDVTFVDMTDLAALAGAVRPGRTRLVWIETPGNPTWEITDIAAAAKIAHEAGALLAVDSTVAAATLTHPLALGADIVMHSATKYLNGHTDVLAGALVTARRDAFWERIVAVRTNVGAVLGAMEAWLLLRGMRTLPLRVARACHSAQAVAERFAGDRRVAAVLYPGLPSHPGHAIAARQMTGGFGGMLSLRIAGGQAAALAAAARLQVWKRATSLGGVESLVEHRHSVEGEDTPTPPDLLRLSVGIEDVGDLIADLDQALG